ncbi:hypothetical protein ACIHCN_39230 [Streptomyces rishiriensis]|uniref:hypothetical protein n=1 Tax=Streptomyces rishiriensis TaxID=68264 RepID=UPI0037D46E33
MFSTQAVNRRFVSEVLDLPADLVLAGGDLDGELAVHGAEEPLDLPASFGASGGGVHQLDAEFHANPQQPRVDESAPVVDSPPQVRDF